MAGFDELALQQQEQAIEGAEQREGGGRTRRKKRRKKRANRQDMTPEQAKRDCIEAVLESGFMPHQKGELQEHCSAGLRMERDIALAWKDIMEREIDSPAPGMFCLPG